MSFVVNEKSSFCLNVVLKNKVGEPLNPITKVEWWVSKPKDQIAYEKQILSDPTPEFTLIIPAEANICDRRKDETRAVVVRVESGVEHVKHDVHPYTVRAFDTVPYPEVAP